MGQSITEQYLAAMATAIDAYSWDTDIEPAEGCVIGPIPPRLVFPQVSVDAFSAQASRKAVRIKYEEPAAMTAIMPVNLDDSSASLLKLLRMRDAFKEIVRDNGRSDVAWGIPPASPSSSGVLTTFIMGWESNYVRFEDSGPMLFAVTLLLRVDYVEYDG